MSILVSYYLSFLFCFFKQKTAYEMRISDWSSDVCSSDLIDDVSTANQLRIVDYIDTRSQYLPASDLLDDAALDPYSFMRDAYLQRLASHEIGRASCRERVCQYV